MKSKLKAIAGALILLFLLARTALAQNAPLKVLHSFGSSGEGSFGTTMDGIGPSSGVIFDKRGNAYGETLGGGANNTGTVYELTPQKDGSWTETLPYIFGRSASGNPVYPNGGLAIDTEGNLYGVTRSGGTNNSGTAFELTPGASGWTETTLHSFCSLPNCADGWEPLTAPILDSGGNLYGSAGQVIYELSPIVSGWTETTLYTFCTNPACPTGADPHALIRDAAGNLYGPAESGGVGDGGVIFRLKPEQDGGWTYSALYDFTSDGAPDAIDLHNGALYGNTVGCEASQCGTIFQVTASGGKIQRNLLYVFTNSNEGAISEGNLAFDSAGNMYGATDYGGEICGCGVVFELAPGTGDAWQYQLIQDLDGQDGIMPQYGVIYHDGHLFGTTLGGGQFGVGVVFEITP
jgi:uncharacterized repeat protein (TIGR03803 family)